MFRSLGPFVFGLGFRVYCRGTSFKACLLSGPLATLFSRCQLAWFDAKIYGTKRIILWLVVASHTRFIGLHLGDAIPHSRPQYQGFGQTKQTSSAGDACNSPLPSGTSKKACVGSPDGVMTLLGYPRCVGMHYRAAHPINSYGLSSKLWVPCGY